TAHEVVAAAEALETALGKFDPRPFGTFGEVELAAGHREDVPALAGKCVLLGAGPILEIVRPLIALLHAFRFGGGRSALGFLRVVAVAGVEGDHEQRSVEKRVHGEGFFDQLLSITGITSMRISSPTSPASPGSRMPARLGALISRMTC